MTTIPPQTEKYVKSLIDGQIYCRKNGQFARHLADHGLTYEEYYLRFLGGSPCLCVCGKRCTFKQSTMSYLTSCGSAKCTGHSISKAKKQRTAQDWEQQRSRYRETMSRKTEKQRQEIIANRIKSYRERHGVDHRLQLNVSPDALEKLSDAEWMRYHHHDLQMTAVKIAETLGVGITTATNWLHRHGINIKIYRCSQAERDVIDTLQKFDPNIVIRQNDRTTIAPLELDIVLPDHQLAFEINGVFWHGETKGKTRQYHLHKTKLCSEQGIRLIHIYDSELALKKPIVLSRIANLIGCHERILYARHCNVREISHKVANEFFEHTHIQGYSSSTYNYGLFHNGKLVAAMSFGTPRFTQHAQYELIRFSTTLHTKIHGGASKLFKYFVSEHNPTSVISYSDNRWNCGSVYEKLGFRHTHMSPPNFYVFKTTDPYTLKSRHTVQKHKLGALLPEFDPTKSAWTNLQEHGYDRIWDCGNKVFLWSKG